MSGRISYLNASTRQFVVKDSRTGQFTGQPGNPNGNVVDIQQAPMPNLGPNRQVLSQRPKMPVVPEGVVSR